MTGWQPLLPAAQLAPARSLTAAWAGGREFALWRSAEGEAQVWENRCPHRSVRLTLGQVVDGGLRCGYHGWTYAAGSGQCAHIPAHPGMQAPRNVRVKTFASAERGGMLWAWLDEDAPAAPPPDLAPPPGWRWLRSMGIDGDARQVRAALAAEGWTPDPNNGIRWQGRLDGTLAAEALLLDARPGLCMLHLFAPASPDMAALHAAARLLRARIEASFPKATP